EVHIATPDAVPLIVALAVGERAVLNGDAVAKCAAKERRHRRSQRNLRDHQQHLPATLLNGSCQAQIDLGLAAAGDAMQKSRAKLASIRQCGQLLEGGVLFGCELARRVWRLTTHDRTFEWVAVFGLGYERDQPACGKATEDVARDTPVAQLARRQADAGRGEDVQRSALLRGEDRGVVRGGGWGEGLAQGECV